MVKLKMVASIVEGSRQAELCGKGIEKKKGECGRGQSSGSLQQPRLDFDDQMCRRTFSFDVVWSLTKAFRVPGALTAAVMTRGVFWSTPHQQMRSERDI